MATPDAFAAKLNLVLKALSLSRGRLAAAVGVDKSVAGRWCSGGSLPSAHSLEALTGFIASKVPDFTMLDWEADEAALAARLGVAAGAVPAPAAALDLAALFPAGLIDEALTTARLRGAAYEGFWRTTRPWAENPGHFVHDHMLQRIGPGGLLQYRLGVFDLRFDGWALPVQDQLFSFAGDAVSGVIIFSVINGVARSKAMALDGITVTCLRNLEGAILATPCLFERVGDLSGDAAADEARLEELMRQSPVAAEGSIPAEVRAHLTPDIGPAAAAAGGRLLMLMAAAQSLSRSAPLGGGAFIPAA